MIALVWALPNASAQSKETSCVSPPVPMDIRDYLKTKYPSYRVKQPSDLRSGLTDWLWFTHRRCPGIAVGKFEPSTDVTYAFLLIPTKSAAPGFRLVTVSRGVGAAMTSKVIASPQPEDGSWENADWFIRAVKLDSYLGREYLKSLQIREGILFVGAGSGVLFWRSGRFERAFADEVDREQ